MANMPMPNGLTLIMMVGNEAAALAGNIAHSVEDHADAYSRYAIGCCALVDDSFQEENAVVENVFYRYTEKGLEQTAVEIALNQFDSMNITLGNEEITQIQLTRAQCVFVADTSSPITLTQIGRIAERLRMECKSRSMDCDVFLGLLADYRNPGRNRAWIMEGDALRPEMSLFQKMLVLSNKDIRGSLGERVNLTRKDAIAPALMLMLGGFEVSDRNRLYTAAYSKVGSTSNDILELKRHIAAETLDAYFANPHGLTTTNAWEFLSTPEMNLTQGHSAAERVAAAADAWLPSLGCVAATADLEDKNFDPVSHVLAFDELNAAAMLDQPELEERWLADVMEKIREQDHLDALLDQLDENGSLMKEILKRYFELFNQRKALVDPGQVRQRLGMTDLKKGLFTQRRDYNLQLLSVIVSNYHILCRERYALSFLSCLRKKIPVIREKLAELIQQRRRILAQYKQAQSKIAVLQDEKMCGNTAEGIRNSYAQTPVELLNTYLSHHEKLYQEDSERYWRKMVKELVKTCKYTNRFAEAFLEGKDQHRLQESIQQLAQNAFALIPNYPEELGPMPLPSNFYLLESDVAANVDDSTSYMVCGVPGDVLEYVALYRLGQDYGVLKTFNLFAESMQIDTYGTEARALRKKSSSTSQAPTSEHNPWGIRVKQTQRGAQLAWNFSNQQETYDIYVNDELVEANYDYKSYVLNGMVYQIVGDSMRGGKVRIRLTCGGESQEIEKGLEEVRSSATLRQSKTRARWMDCELIRCVADVPDGVTGKCLLIHEGQQVYRAPLPVCDVEEAGPLWLPEGADEIELGELN